jgi:hypothetical protein
LLHKNGRLEIIETKKKNKKNRKWMRRNAGKVISVHENVNIKKTLLWPFGSAGEVASV